MIASYFTPRVVCATVSVALPDPGARCGWPRCIILEGRRLFWFVARDVESPVLKLETG